MTRAMSKTEFDHRGSRYRAHNNGRYLELQTDVGHGWEEVILQLGPDGNVLDHPLERAYADACMRTK